MPDEDPSGSPFLPRPRQEGYHPKGLRPIIPRTPLIPLDPAGAMPVPLPPIENQDLPSTSMVEHPPSTAFVTEFPLLTVVPQGDPVPASPGPAPLSPEPAPGTLSTGLLPPSPAAAPANSGGNPSSSPTIEGDKTAKLLPRSAPPEAVPTARPTNERRSMLALKLFGLSLLIMVASFATFATLLYSFFEHNIEPRLGIGFAVPAPPKSEAPPPVQVPAQIPDELKTQLASATAQLGADRDQISRLQKQIEALRSQQSQAETQLKTFDARLLEAQVAAAAPRPSDLASNVQITTDPEHATPDGIAVLQELRLLKERNRLTFYADQALANASSKAMASLWNAVRDPELVFVRDGAVAEIIRVQHFYGMLPGLPPSYHLPVRELFHDDAIRTDADLNDDQVTKLLLDETQPLEVRTRAAALLSGRRDNKVGNALVEAMRHDPNLNVVKAAQHTLQENYELYAPRLFDAVGMAAAWKERLAKATRPVPPEIQVRPPKD